MHLPDELLSPGDFIRDTMEKKGWQQGDLAYALGVSPSTVNQILGNKRSISSDMAKALGLALGVEPREIAHIQADWDINSANMPKLNIEIRSKILSKYPLRDMVKRGWINPENGQGTLEEQICRFFDVSHLGDVPHLQHSAKKTNYEKILPEQLAWIFRVKAIASEMLGPRYDKIKLQQAIKQFSQLRAKADGVRHVPKLLKNAGVRFVIVEGLPKSAIDGVCFWIHNQSIPVIGMSLRYDRIDNFWFVLRHECAHVLHEHSKSEIILDCELGTHDSFASVSTKEQIANQEAEDFCVPTDRMTSFYLRKKPYFAECEVEAFAKIVGTHPGLVVGQLQHRMGRYDFLRKHLVKIRAILAMSMMMDGWGTPILTDK